MATAIPHIYPIDNPEIEALWRSVGEAVKEQRSAADIMGMIQESIDRQAAAIEHAAIIDRLTKIFAAIVKQSTNSIGDLATYCLAFVDLLNHALAVRCKIAWSSLKKSVAPDWLQKYALTDFDACANILYESLGSKEQPQSVETSRIMCAEFIADLAKNLIVIAQGNRELAIRWDSAVDQMLEDMQNEDEDVFGIEGQYDPRGDRRG